jgi:molecular chaperone GrpE
MSEKTKPKKGIKIESLEKKLQDGEKLRQDFSPLAIQIEELKKELKECQKEKDNYLKGWQRERADFLNYKKEETERIKGFLKYAGESLTLEILPILDNLEKAQKELPEDFRDNNYVEGILQIKKQFEDLLKGQGIEKIETLGRKFDPNFHEVVEEIEYESRESGTIVEEVKAGYMLRDKLLRAAKVKVVK